MTNKQFPRKKTALVLAAVLSLSMVFGGFGFAREGANPVRELSLEKSIELALANNSDIKLAKLAVEKAEVGLEKAQTFSKDENIPQMYKNSMEEGRMKRLYPRQAEAQLTIDKQTREFTGKKVKLEVEKTYYDVLRKAKLLEVKKLTLQRAREQVRLAQANFKAGRAAKVDVTSAETLVAAAQAELSVYDTQYKVAVMNFNKLIGLDIDTPVKLTAKLAYIPLNNIDLEKSIRDALENSVDLVAEREKKAISDVLFGLEKSYYSAAVYSYQEKQIEAKKAELTLKDKEIDMRIAVKQAYLNLRSAEDRIKVLSKSLEKQKESVRIATLKYKVGLATNADLLDVNVALDEIEEKYAGAIYDFNVAKAQFENGLFILGQSAAGMAGDQ